MFMENQLTAQIIIKKIKHIPAPLIYPTELETMPG